MYAGAKPRPAGAMTNDSDQSAGFPGGGAKAGIISRVRNYFLTGLVVAADCP